MTNLKVGDWCFHDYELVQIKKIEDGMIREVTNGVVCCSGHELDVEEISMRAKVACDNAEYVSRQLLDSKLNLNIPDLHRALVDWWHQLCDPSKTEDQLTKCYERFSKWSRELRDKIRDLSIEELDGVRLFRR